jgi:hypothetical protein
MKALSSVTSLFSVLAVLSSAVAAKDVRGVDPAGECSCLAVTDN